MHTAFNFYTLRNILPEAICCCLHACCLYIVLLELCNVYMPTFIATIALVTMKAGIHIQHITNNTTLIQVSTNSLRQSIFKNKNAYNWPIIAIVAMKVGNESWHIYITQFQQHDIKTNAYNWPIIG